MNARIPVWDLPTRITHWSLVACFVGLFVTGDSERWRDIHAWLGYTLLALMLFRVIWGFVGSRYARFADFVQGPKVIASYLATLVSGAPRHFVGHNPAGALAILALLLLGITGSVSGWLTYEEIGGDLFEELHEGLANLMLAVVLIHVGGVIVSSFLHRENLARAMVTGSKMGDPGEANRQPHRLVGALLLLALVGFWGWALSGHLPAGGASASGEYSTDQTKDDDDD